MHCCLNIDEIVRLIAWELVTSRRKATAVRLACCCKSFEDPVLDTLWATGLGLTNLLGCFPGDVWNEDGCGVSTPTTYALSSPQRLVQKPFERLPTAVEWTRFLKYARRIRELRDHNAQRTLHFTVYHILRRYVFNGPLLPNLTTLDLRPVREPLISSIRSLVPPTITSISLGSLAFSLSESGLVLVIEDLPTNFPNVRDIIIRPLPRTPLITAAASKMFLTTNRNTLRRFHVDSPLTEEATEATYKSQNLCGLSVVIEKGTPMPSAPLPNLIHLQIRCDDGSDGLQLLRRVTSGKLKSVDFTIKSRPADDFLEAFKEAAFSSSIQDTLSAIRIVADWSWKPNYSSLLPFTRLVDLEIQTYCDDSCSRVDDDIIIDLSRAMPKLESLKLGSGPCRKFTGGVTVEGLVALAYNCPNLSSLCVHFQVASLSDPPTGPDTTRNAGYPASWTGCALTELEVGEMPVPEGSAPMVALTLLRIFPRIKSMGSWGRGWGEVEDMICRSKQIVDCSSKYHHLTILQNSSLTPLRRQTYGP